MAAWPTAADFAAIRERLVVLHAAHTYPRLHMQLTPPGRDLGVDLWAVMADATVLLATAEALARAVVTAEKYVEFARQGRCYWCSGVDDHTPDCIVHRARALVGEPGVGESR